MRGIKRLQKEILRVRRRFVPGALIINYHRVTDLSNDPYLLAVSPDNFRKHLEYIKSRFVVLPLLELNDALNMGKLPNRAVAVTFDDGYMDVLEQATPILKALQIPATVFITTGQIGSRREFWWDELERLILLPDSLPEHLDLSIRDQAYQWNIFSIEDKRRLSEDLYHLIKPLKYIERINVLDRLVDWAGLEQMGRPQYRAMDEFEVTQLTQDELIDIGAHTVTHPALSHLTFEEQYEEIILSRRMLEEITGFEILTFAYPYGKAEDYSKESVQIVKEAGFSLSCTSIRGSVEVGCDLFQLNRCSVHNWGIDQFIRNIEGFFVLR